jgi:hypothetical protein
MNIQHFLATIQVAQQAHSAVDRQLVLSLVPELSNELQERLFDIPGRSLINTGNQSDEQMRTKIPHTALWSNVQQYNCSIVMSQAITDLGGYEKMKSIRITSPRYTKDVSELIGPSGSEQFSTADLMVRQITAELIDEVVKVVGGLDPRQIVLWRPSIYVVQNAYMLELFSYVELSYQKEPSK